MVNQLIKEHVSQKTSLYAYSHIIINMEDAVHVIWIGFKGTSLTEELPFNVQWLIAKGKKNEEIVHAIVL